jgi:hypothetical protein
MHFFQNAFFLDFSSGFSEKRKEEGFWEGYGSLGVMGFRIIGPLAEAIKGPSVYFDVIFLQCLYTMK